MSFLDWGTGGGYIVTPLKSGASGKPRTLVEFVLEMNVAGWSSLFGIGLCTYPVHLRNSLLSVVAGLTLFLLQSFSLCG